MRLPKMTTATTRSRLARPLAAAAIALLALPVGCATDDAMGIAEEDLTNVANTEVKRQSIGNCWIYATVGWAESLHLSQHGAKLNLSESYLSYWHWYEEIAGGPSGSGAVAYLDQGQISTGGFWGVAGELMLRYGLMDEGSFIPEEAEAQRSERQSLALAAINTSLKTGALATATARKDRTLVRAELDKAWQLNAQVVGKLNGVFGKNVATHLAKTAKTLPAGMRHPRDMTVGWVTESGKQRMVTLAEAIGTASSSYDFARRSGKYAWTESFYPSTKTGTSRRTFLKGVQQALHLKLPVIMTWFVDFNAMGADKTFRAPPATPGRQGGHMTVIEDYEVTDVPGFGTLKAGIEVTDPKALTAALDAKAKISFFRIKNSWGGDLAPQGAADDFKGFHDLFMEYLNGPIKECTGSEPNKCATTRDAQGLRAMVVPPAAFRSGK